MLRTLLLALAIAIGCVSVAEAQCVGAGGIPFNCQPGSAPPGATDLFMGGSASGSNTVKWTGAQVAIGVFGQVPALSGGGTVNFLRADGTWSVPAGTGGGSVSSASVATANGFSGTVANPTSTPAFTLGTTVTGLLKGNGTAISAATPGTDYLAPTGSGAGLSGVLPLAGGTLTGPLIGTSGAFSGTLSAAGTVSGAGFTALLSPYALASSDALKLPLAGGTLTGALIGTSATFTAFNAWAPTFGVRDDSVATPSAAGTSYAVGDQITLDAGCATGAQHNPMVVVAGVATGAITAYNVVDHGACSIAPANNVSALSTSGAGTGAAFTLSWAPLAGGIPVSDNANVNAGNLFITGTPPKYFSGTESVGVGIRPMRFVGLPGSSFNVAMGHNVEGGAGCPDAPTYVSSSTMLGTDTMRNSCGHSQVTLYGVSAMKAYAQTGTAANRFAYGSTGVGAATLGNWNAPIGDVYNTALGDNSCAGNVTGTVQFSGVACLGARTGGNLRDATNTLIISSGGQNPGTVAGNSMVSGNNVIMMGTGQNVIDVPAASTSNYISINNVIIGTMQAQPTFVSGFNLGAGFNGVASGQSSFRFGWNGGTTGGASGGVFAFPTPAPHGWDCRGRDRTNPASTEVDFAPTSTTQVTMTTYSRTTGLVAAYASGDVFDISCMGF